MKIYLKAFALLAIFQTSCSKDEPIPLIASAGESQNVKPQDQITLDGSQSTGPESFTYSWAYSGDIPESEINFQNTNSANPTFVPPKSAVYIFTLTINSGELSSSDQVTVVASGGIEIGGTLESDLALIDIEPDAGVPDYIVTSDLIVPAGITLSVADENVVIYFESGTGLHVKDGGKLTNMIEGQEEALNIVFTGNENDGWKGIWIENSSIDLNQSKLEYAGKQKFEELSEPAALILSGSQTDLISIDGNKFKQSFSYDVMVPDQIGGDGYFMDNDLSYKNPVKAHITFLDFYFSNYPNLYPENHEYSIFIPSGPDKMDIINRTFRFFDGRFYIDGEFWAGSPVAINRATVYMKEGTGLLAQEGFNSSSTSAKPDNLITGLGNTQWKGIAISGMTVLSIGQTIIENAGYGIIEIGDFTAETNASIYTALRIGSIKESKIINGGGFGYYNADTASKKIEIIVTANEFRNLKKAAIRTDVTAVSRLYAGFGTPNIFDLPSNVPAILVQGDGTPTIRWAGLGNGNFYLIDANIITDRLDGFKLGAGAHLKFRSGRSYVYNIIPNAGAHGTQINFEGTADNPVILEGEVDMPGSWGGVYLGCQASGYFNMNYCIIRNGGEFMLPDASEKANFSFLYNGFDSANNRFNNCTFSDSQGYGIVVEERSYDPEFDNPNKNNTFSNNALGDIVIK